LKLRTPILAANWKMQKTTGDTLAFLDAFLPLVEDVGDVEIVIAPPFTALSIASGKISDSRVKIASQNVNPEEKGAFTGEISIEMLRDVGCAYAIVGHSERRHLYGESDAFVARKAGALLANGLLPIVCVGETLEEREADRTFDVVANQLAGSLAEVPADRAAEVVVAYEPVWAIGTGKTATPEIAQDVHAFIRGKLKEQFPKASDAMRIQYGGSVKPENVYDLMSRNDIDGALVGGASLDPESFAKIVRFNEQGAKGESS
jgi:triosephosphate isomerase